MSKINKDELKAVRHSAQPQADEVHRVAEDLKQELQTLVRQGHVFTRVGANQSTITAVCVDDVALAVLKKYGIRYTECKDNLANMLDEVGIKVNNINCWYDVVLTPLGARDTLRGVLVNQTNFNIALEGAPKLSNFVRDGVKTVQYPLGLNQAVSSTLVQSGETQGKIATCPTKPPSQDHVATI